MSVISSVLKPKHKPYIILKGTRFLFRWLQEWKKESEILFALFACLLVQVCLCEIIYVYIRKTLWRKEFCMLVTLMANGFLVVAGKAWIHFSYLPFCWLYLYMYIKIYKRKNSRHCVGFFPLSLKLLFSCLFTVFMWSWNKFTVFPFPLHLYTSI